MGDASMPTYLVLKYDKFLQSSVGDDKRGAGVTVLSMMARLGIDPWREASKLAAMPKDSAHQRLDALLARFTDVPSWVPSRRDVGLRLLTFLPQGGLADDSALDGRPIEALLRSSEKPLHVVLLVGVLLAYYAARFFSN